MRKNSYDNSIVEDLATFGDVVILPAKQPPRAESVPRNKNRPVFHTDSYALPEEKPKQTTPVEDDDKLRKVKPSANWRNKREPNFEKIGDRRHEQRVRSEQARIATQRFTNEPKNPASNRIGLVSGRDPVDSRRRRNLLPA